MQIEMGDIDVPVYVRTGGLVRATLISRPNRFLAIARLDSDNLELNAGESRPGSVKAHVADPGRLEELLFPGAIVYLCRAKPGNARIARKTEYSLVLAEHNGILVSVDSRVPNELTYTALQSGFFEELREYRGITRESVYLSSRFDFRLTSGNRHASDAISAAEIPDCFVEVKSVTLIRDNIALFPDAPTVRGARHMRELAAAVSQGFRAMVIFVIQREDAEYFAPNAVMDPQFAEALCTAVCANVGVIAVKCDIAESGAITLNKAVPVILPDCTLHPK